MMIRNVTVFGASGRQGLAQVKRLRDEGFRVRAITRRAGPLEGPEFFGTERRAADYKDPASLEDACKGADAVFYTAPAFAEQSQGIAHSARVGAAAKSADVKRLIFNTSSWVPDEPIGNRGYDGRLKMEEAIAASGVPYTIFRPVLFMDNLLTNWSRPFIVRESQFTYPHKPTLEASWISLEDVAAFMTEALRRPDLEGERIVIGGPEKLTPPIIAAILSKVLGRTISFKSLTPREFGELMWDIFKDVTDVPRESYVGGLEAFYSFNNTANIQPFLVDMAPVLSRIPIRLTPFAEWAARQNWTLSDDGVPGG